MRGEGEAQRAQLGNRFFSHSAKTNDATMAAFRAALEQKYGVFGTHAFDMVLGARAQTHKSLRAADVTATLSKLETVKKNRFIGELSRQLDTNPVFRDLPAGLRKLVRETISASPVDGSLKDCATDADLAKRAVRRIERAIDVARDFAARKGGNAAGSADATGDVAGGRRARLRRFLRRERPEAHASGRILRAQAR